MQTITHGGDWVTLLVVSSAGAAFLFFQQHRNREALLLLLAFGLGHGANSLLKLIFQRQRPQLWEVLARPDSYSFPSGHAMSSMMVYGVAALLLVRLFPRFRRVWVVSAALWILLIGFSRIYLGVHWLSDVVAGFAAGFAFVYAVARWHRLSGRTTRPGQTHSPLR